MGAEETRGPGQGARPRGRGVGVPSPSRTVPSLAPACCGEGCSALHPCGHEGRGAGLWKEGWLCRISKLMGQRIEEETGSHGERPETAVDTFLSHLRSLRAPSFATDGKVRAHLGRQLVPTGGQKNAKQNDSPGRPGCPRAHSLAARCRAVESSVGLVCACA